MLSGGWTSHRSSVPPMEPSTAKASTSPAPFGTAGVEVGDGVQSSYELCQRATVVGHPARFSSLSIRGARTKFFSLSNDSGAAIALLSWIVVCLFSFSSSHSSFYLSSLLFSSLNAWLADLLIVSSYYSFSEFRTASFFRLITQAAANIYNLFYPLFFSSTFQT